MVMLFTLIITHAKADVIGGYIGDAPNVELRVSVNGRIILGEQDLEKILIKELETKDTLPEDSDLIEQNAISLSLGESIQLKVEMIEPNGTVTDITTNPAIFYEVIGTEALSITQQGLLTALTNAHLPKLSQILIVYNTRTRSGFNYLFIRLTL